MSFFGVAVCVWYWWVSWLQENHGMVQYAKKEGNPHWESRSGPQEKSSGPWMQAKKRKALIKKSTSRDSLPKLLTPEALLLPHLHTFSSYFYKHWGTKIFSIVNRLYWLCSLVLHHPTRACLDFSGLPAWNQLPAPQTRLPDSFRFKFFSTVTRHERPTKINVDFWCRTQ